MWIPTTGTEACNLRSAAWNYSVHRTEAVASNCRELWITCCFPPAGALFHTADGVYLQLLLGVIILQAYRHLRGSASCSMAKLGCCNMGLSPLAGRFGCILANFLIGPKSCQVPTVHSIKTVPVADFHCCHDVMDTAARHEICSTARSDTRQSSSLCFAALGACHNTQTCQSHLVAKPSKGSFRFLVVPALA